LEDVHSNRAVDSYCYGGVVWVKNRYAQMRIKIRHAKNGDEKTVETLR